MRRRINLRFLAIGGLFLIGTVGLVLAGRKLFIRENPESYRKSGDLFMSERRWSEAANNYNIAAGLDKSNPEYLIAAGDAYWQQSSEDPTVLGNARMSYEKALQIQSNNLDALRRLMTFHEQEAQILEAQGQPRQATYDRMQETASRLAEVATGDLQRKARAAVPLSVLRPWLNELAIGDATKVDKATAQIEELMKNDAENADLPFYLARAKIKQAIELDKKSDSPNAYKKFAEAAQVFDTVLRTQDQLPSMNYRAAIIYSMLAAQDRSPASSAKYGNKVLQAINRAQTLSKPTDPLYIEINQVAAQVAKQRQDRAGAEHFLREVFNNFPNDPRVRLNLAHFLGEDPARREEAIQLLQTRPSAANLERYKGVDAYRLGVLENDFLIELTNLRIESYYAANDASQRQTLMALIEDGYKKVANKLGLTDPRSMMLQGRWLLCRGDVVEAIQVFEQLRMVYENQINKGNDYYDMLFLLARAYYQAGQNGMARQMAERILEDAPNNQGVRIFLVQLLLQENRIATAKKELDTLEGALPNYPQVLKLRMQQLDKEDHEANAALVRKYFDRLPESDRLVKLDKAQQAMQYQYNEDALRLLNDVHALDPGDPIATGSLVQFCLGQKKTNEARRAVTEALQVNPKNQELKMLQEQVENPDPQMWATIRDRLADPSGDEFARELHLYQIARSKGNLTDMLLHLRQAERIRPADGEVSEYLFRYYLTTREWKEAEKYLPRLARLDRDRVKGKLFEHMLAMAKGEYAGAVNIGRELTRSYSQFGQSWLALAQALYALGQNDEAITAYVSTIERIPNSGDAYSGIINCYLRMNRQSEARRYIFEARERLPSEPYFKEQQISFDLKYGNPEDALKLRQQMQNENPESAGQKAALGLAYIQCAQSKSATDAVKSQEYIRQAVETLKQGMEKWPGEQSFYGAMVKAALFTNDTTTAADVIRQFKARPEWKDKPEPWILEAEFFTLSGKSDEAESALRSAIQKAPQRVDIELRMADLLSQQGKLDAALDILKANSDSPAVQQRRVETLIAAKRLEEAEQAVQQALKQGPEQRADFQSLLAFVYLNEGKLDEAIQAAQQTLQRNPSHPWALRYMGAIYLQKGNPDLALKYLLALRDQSPDDLQVRISVYQAYLKAGDPDNAIRELESTLRVAPQNKDLRRELFAQYMSRKPPKTFEALQLIQGIRSTPQGRSDSDWINLEANYWLSLKEYDKALATVEPYLKVPQADPAVIQTYLNILLQSDNCKRLLDESSSFLDNKALALNIHLLRAAALRKMKDLPGALKEYDTAITVAQTDGKSEIVEAIVLENIPREISIDAALERALQRRDSSTRWRMICAFLHHLKQQESQALELIQAVLVDYDKLSPKDQENALRMAGSIYLTLRPQPMMREAFEVYKKLLKIAPQDINALNNMANILLEGVNPPRVDEALKYITQAYDLMRKSGQNYPDIIDTYGWLLTQSGRLDEGIDILQALCNDLKISNKENEKPEVRYHLAMAYLNRSFPDEAKSQLYAAKELIKKSQKSGSQVDPNLEGKIAAALATIEKMEKNHP